MWIFSLRNSRKKMLKPTTMKLFNRLQNTSSKSLAHIDLKNNEYKRHPGAHVAQFCFHDTRGHYGCWYHIQYVLKPFRMYWFIYERHQIVSHSAWLMLSPILVLRGRRWWWGELVGNVVMSGCAGGLSSERWGRREGRVIVVAIVVGVQQQLRKTKQGRGRKQFKSPYWSSTSDCTYIPQSHRPHSCVS